MNDTIVRARSKCRWEPDNLRPMVHGRKDISTRPKCLSFLLEILIGGGGGFEV